MDEVSVVSLILTPRSLQPVTFFPPLSSTIPPSPLQKVTGLRKNNSEVPKSDKKSVVLACRPSLLR